MGTEKRERQKANRAKRREEEIRLERVSAVRRTAFRWGAIIVLAIGSVVLIAWVAGAFDGGDDDAPAIITLPPLTSPAELPGGTEPTTAPTTAAP